MNNNSKEYSNNMKKYIDFLSKNKINKNTDNKKFTHTSLGHPFGSYEFNAEKNSKLIDIYSNAVCDLSNELYLSEAHLSRGPILIDIDIKYNLKEKNTNHFYNYDDIEQLIKIYNKHIKNYLNIQDDDFKAYLLEKNEPTMLNVESLEYCYKDGIHIIYPFICATNYLQFIIREEVIVELKNSRIWEKFTVFNNLEDIIDKAVIERNNWLMYGSGKPSSDGSSNINSRYFLTRIYRENMTYILRSAITDVDQYNLPKILSIRKFTSIDDLSELHESYNWDGIQELWENNNSKKKSLSFNTSEKDIKIAKSLVSILSINRCNDFQKWIELGFCLHNISDNLLECWIDFSRQNTAKFKAGECEKRWNAFKNYGFTIRSLHRWAREDNKTKYFEFMMNELNDIMKRSLSGTSYDVAKAFYELYKYNYVCASIKNKSWYEFKNHRWILVEEAYTIYSKLNEDMVVEYLKMAQLLGNAASLQSGEEKDTLLNKQQAAIKLCSKIRSSSFKKQILDELIKLFYNPNFINEMDESRNLICFLNGVYDLENDLFREGRPEDNITLCTNINYIPYVKNDQYIMKVESFFNDILPEEDIKNYVLDLISSCLQGHIPDEKFHIWTGTGGNGKSMTIALIHSALGDYACTLPVSMITSKRASSTSANPEMAKTKGKRFAIFQEPEHNQKINVSQMKEITSNNDKISARGLFKEPIEFYPQFKLFLACNDIPEPDGIDGGTKRRLRIVPFEMKYVDEPKLPNERKINKNLKDEMPLWKEPLMSILINRFKNYKTNGLKEPSKVTLYTLEYQKDSDIYLEFIDTNLQKTSNNEDKLSIQVIYNVFKAWFRNSHSGGCMIDMKDLKKCLQERLGKFSKYLIGYKFINEEEATIDVVDQDIDSNTVKISADKKKSNKSSKTNINSLDV
jgi:P4 family phage/plasmid primase-like protien